MPSIALPVSLRGQLLSGTRTFSPASLFSANEPGVWFDPSDLTTLFQDPAGTTPVTTPGQTVGLMLDKSKGLALGAELVANGTFDGNSTTGWAGTNSTLSSTSDALVVTPTTTNASAYTAVNLVVGKTYVIEADIVAVNGSTQGKRLNVGTTITGSQMLQYIVASTPQSLRAIFVATATVGYVNVYTFDGVNATVWDNISVRELAGNHATQSVLASRPVYGIEPAGGRRNLLTFSEDYLNGIWVKSGTTVSSTSVADPEGGNTASTITASGGTGYFFYNTASNPTVPTIPSLWIRRRTGTGVIGLRTDPTTGTDTPITVTSTWQRVSVNSSAAGGPTQNCWVLRIQNSGDAVDIWHPQLETGAVLTPYQRVTTAFDVTEAGVQTCHYVQYDGSDDGMITNSIDFTATDKMSVFAGVRKLSDAAQAAFIGLSIAPSTNSGTFELSAPGGGLSGEPYNLRSRGTSNSFASAGIGYSAPITNIITALGDISGDLATLRVNGAQAAQATTDQGTGNYGNYPLYLGRRGGSTLPFNGRDYGIVIVGKATTPAEITSTESWLSGKTGFYAPVITGVPTIGVS